MSRVYIIENKNGETIASFDKKIDCINYLGTTNKSFDCKMHRLRTGECEYMIVKDTREKVKVYVVQVEDD